MLFKDANFALFCQKIWLSKQIIINLRSITKNDPAIEIEPSAYCNISPLNYIQELS